MAAFSEFEGRWKQISSENFDGYMKGVGIGLFIRKAANLVTVTLVINVNGNQVECKQLSAFKNTELNFKIEEEFDEETPDGRKFKSTVYPKDGKMVHHQKPIKDGDVESKITRWVEGDKLFVLMEAKGVQCRRVYKRIE